MSQPDTRLIILPKLIVYCWPHKPHNNGDLPTSVWVLTFTHTKLKIISALSFNYTICINLYCWATFYFLHLFVRIWNWATIITTQGNTKFMPGFQYYNKWPKIILCNIFQKIRFVTLLHRKFIPQQWWNSLVV